MTSSSKKFQKQAAIFKKHGRVLKTSVALQLGIHPRDLYGMRQTWDYRAR